MTEQEFQTIITKLDNLEENVERDYQLLSEKLELYRQTSETQINSVRAEVKVFQEANKQQIEAFQDANKQQLNVSLGVLVTAAVTILASVVLGMQ